ncbi:DUF1592 domain-containing protein, partial [Verrucomicrobia bacterium]|nr:DUF1592 domain-containing protein [Verrucomicrobiota bacterium]
TAEPKVAGSVLGNFMEQAFRRPLSKDEVAPYVNFFKSARGEGDSFQDAIYYALRGVLVSPHFLLRTEAPNQGMKPEPVSDYELATRLSYFLWASQPDKELTNLAKAGKLGETEVLGRQVLRMVKHGKAFDFAEDFVGQWLGTRELGLEFRPDAELFESYNERLESVLRSEPAYFFQGMLKENGSLLDLIDSDYTYANSDMLRHYKISAKGKKVQGSLGRFDLPEGSPRGGVMTMGAVLAVSSYPHRTSPVLRGKWLMEKILGSSPPPPPPDVPPLEEKEETGTPTTLRERLQMHRADPTCASCHDRIDPIGFGLENFDAIGRWRDTESGKPIDATGALPGGLSYQGVKGLKQALKGKPEKFIRHFTTQMLAYALGRGMVESDYPVIDGIVKRISDKEFKVQELILAIVESKPFRLKRPVSAETNRSTNQ